jgi:hypothetical protein
MLSILRRPAFPTTVSLVVYSVSAIEFTGLSEFRTHELGASSMPSPQLHRLGGCQSAAAVFKKGRRHRLQAVQPLQ